ncbi:MAG: hypothetical protein KGJ13_01165 [Patescibacteria group bacterium]|nr:hypothetical protein [Patescibacteria group bacterium]
MQEKDWKPNFKKKIAWTSHAQAKMKFYKLSRQRVLRVLHSPKRIEEGVAPKTVAAMQPASVKMARVRSSGAAPEGRPRETWNQELWVMVEDTAKERKIISAWRYPGMSKPRSAITLGHMRQEFEEYQKGGLSD